jgi:hypothetical protein
MDYAKVRAAFFQLRDAGAAEPGTSGWQSPAPAAAPVVMAASLAGAPGLPGAPPPAGGLIPA